MASTTTVTVNGTVTNKITTMKTADLFVDHTVQRTLNMRRVDAMVEDFEKEALRVLVVSHRDDGTLHIVDGQHRWAAASKVGIQTLQCMVYSGLTKPQEAALFRVLNNTKIVNAIDKFLVRVVEGDLAAVYIHSVITKAGWNVSTSYKGNGAFAAVAAIEWVYHGGSLKPNSRQEAPVRQIFEILTAAWGYDPDAGRADIVRGLGLFLIRYGHVIDLAKVVHMLAKLEGGPLKLTADARLSRSLRRTTASDSVAEILTNLYNHKRTVNRLPSWFSGGTRRVAADEED